ncbi:minor tail protein L [Dickeya phage Sucellus]|nr:minor tail protein L [Dickeya phage Sucellus]
MSRIIPDKLNSTLDSLEQDAEIVLIVADLTNIAQEAGVFRFYSGVNQLSKPLVWQGFTYEPFPTELDGLSLSGTGKSGRPTLSLSNITGMITGLVINYSELVGSVVTIKVVSAKFLDSINFKNGNPNADPNQEIELRYIVNKLNQLDPSVATFELSLPSEYDKAVIPARTITSGSCLFKYRGDGCGYDGQRMFDYRDNEVFVNNLDVCGRRKESCVLRFGEGNAIHHGGFLSVDRVG